MNAAGKLAGKSRHVEGVLVEEVLQDCGLSDGFCETFTPALLAGSRHIRRPGENLSPTVITYSARDVSAHGSMMLNGKGFAHRPSEQIGYRYLTDLIEPCGLDNVMTAHRVGPPRVGGLGRGRPT